MNLYDNYSDLFLLLKLVAARHAPCLPAVHLELSFEMDDNLNFVLLPGMEKGMRRATACGWQSYRGSHA